MTHTFVHLRLHSEYSLADGIVRINELIQVARNNGMPAVAITDRVNLFALVKFYRAAIRAGLKPIIGADLWLENMDDHNKPYRLPVLCQDANGYKNLCALITRAYEEGQHSERPCINPEWLRGNTDGLIALSGAQEGDLGQALVSKNKARVSKLVQRYREWFPGRFYLELQRTGHMHQEDYNHAAVELAEAQKLPVVATNHVHFIKQEEFEPHEARVCIYEGRTLNDNRRPRHFTPQQYFRSTEEMVELFKDIPEAIENSVHIARRCNFKLHLGEYHLPDYPVPEGMTIDGLLRKDAEAGLVGRIQQLKLDSLDINEQEYRDRLNEELAVIIDMGFPGYFLIVADFIKWARENDVPVGPGRGSGAGSLVAYSLRITNIDPIGFDLLFERFLNPERVSMPDFDIDFCMEKRDQVIEYVNQRYGSDKVSQIITYGTMAARAVVRDVGRVLSHPYGFVDQLAKLVPFEIGMTLDKALEQEPMLKERYEQEEDVQALIDMARALEGISRNAGKHAGGVVISPRPLVEFMPLYCEQGGKQKVSQLDKDDLETIGLVKFDFLGLRNLTIIDKAVKTINRERKTKGEELLDIDHLPLDDRATFDLLKSCKTTALFQLESRGMKDLIGRLQPDNFEEIIALVALFRPGPLQSGMVDDFIDRKHGRARIEYPHASLEPILKPTYGVILYQEQVMQIAQVLSGYSLGGADLLRRAMGKKKLEEMAKQRDVFIKGAVENNVSPQLSGKIFDLIEKFAGYGFNRSHSAAYALLAYQTAWLKAHYPAAFMAAVLSSDMDNTDKVVTMTAECRDMGLELEVPDANVCEYEFLPEDGKTIYYGLGAIKGLGRSAIDAILSSRKESGPFQDLFDLCKRIDLRKVNRRTLESLIRAGALDQLGPHRASMMATLDTALRVAGRHTENEAAGMTDMFSNGDEDNEHEFVQAAEWGEEFRLEGEKETLGLYLTGHPIERYVEELGELTDGVLSDLKPNRNQEVTVAGLVVAVRTMQTKRGDRMAFLTLDDRTSRMEIAVFSDLYQKCRDLLVKDTLLVVKGPVSVDEYSGGFKMRAEHIYDLDKARNTFAKRLEIKLDSEQLKSGFIQELQGVLSPVGRGQCPVWVTYKNQDAAANIKLGEEWNISLSGPVLEKLKELNGIDKVNVIYH